MSALSSVNSGGATHGCSPGADGPARVLDVRLLVPALTCWVVDVALLWAGVPRWAVLAVAAVAVLIAASSVLGRDGSPDRRSGSGLGRRARRWPVVGRWPTTGPVLGLAASAVALTTACLAGHDAVRTAGIIGALAEQRSSVLIEAVIESDPHRVSARPDRLGEGEQVVLRARVTTLSGRGVQSSSAAPILLVGDASWAKVQWQEQVRARGRLAPVAPGEEVVAVLRTSGPPELLAEAPIVARWAAYVRARFREATARLPPDAAGLIPALVVGDTSSTPVDLADAMTVAGMSHLSAVSGSNVAIVLGAALGVARWLGVRRRWRPVVAFVVLVGFVVLARPEPSVVRAAVMGTVGLAGLSVSRQRTGVPALAAAVVVLLCWDPWLARSYGFALSVLATLGLLVFVPGWGRRLGRLLPGPLRRTGPYLAVPLAAQVMCAPVVVLLQSSVSVVAVPANLAADPFVAPATIAGVVTALVSVVWVDAATWLGWAAALPALAIAWIARTAAGMPWGVLPWPAGPPGALLLAGVSALIVLCGPWVRFRAGQRPLAAVAVLALAAAFWVPTRSVGWPLPNWALVACDVGQGDALVVATAPGHAVLVDTGIDPAAVDGCLSRLGVGVLDAVILTHFHADHVGGLAGALRGRAVVEILTSPVEDPDFFVRQVRRLAEGAGVPVRTIYAGDRLQWFGVTARVWWPARLLREGSVPNNGSVVLSAEVHGLHAVLLADVEREAARAVLGALRWDSEFAAWGVDVVKIAHHGSANAEPALLDLLGGAVGVISVGADNDYGHPAPSTLAELSRRGMVVLRTDWDGDVAVGRPNSGPVLVSARGP